ncbi:TetR/AcrR family transcriptional regulator [Georgenia satyanarayanai]|uniref:TetR/AcrR family transcriptional regulator n=1 Tax=Georgenia satyanarayanai TaxID=860221 RepID=UPI00203D67F3|nr:TetR/AcrR family transcriptional regulator [Georgenia satyanarayanai]MCM3659399.1 TetR/AcrR family transcriptional regulator [Georgenia satyanarayanai]
MGRPRAFDKDQALLIAMERFWSDGYESTTVSRLTQEMGISAPSLYAAFGDKNRLFEDAAASYSERITEQVDRALERRTAHEGVTELLRITAEGMAAPGSPPGCFMLSEPRLRSRRETIRQRVAERIARGQVEGDVSEGVDPQRLGDYLMAVMVGMSSRAKDGGSSRELLGIAESAAAALPALMPSLR